jgi:hypothetical protein
VPGERVTESGSADPEEDYTERHQHGDPDLSRSFD